MKKDRSGQSLIEILMPVVIGAILVVAAVGAMVPALSVNRQATPLEVGTSLGAELLNNVRVWSEGDWHGILSLRTGTANIYYLNASSSPFTAVGASSTGGQVLAVGTSTYIRYFYVADTYRASDQIVSSGGVYDPSTKLVTVVYGLSGSMTSSLSVYLTRHGDNVYDQTDWAGGPNASGSATTTNNQFATSSNIDYSTTTGSIYIAIPGY